MSAAVETKSPAGACLVEPAKRMKSWRDVATLMGIPYKTILQYKHKGAPEFEGKTCVDWVQKWLDRKVAALTVDGTLEKPKSG